MAERSTCLIFIAKREEQRAKARIARLGIPFWVAEMAVFKRKNRDRVATLQIEPYFPGIIFADLTAADFYAITNVPGVCGTIQPLGPRDKVDLDQFRQRVSEEWEVAHDTQKRAEARKELIAAFTQGQAIKVISGPLADTVLKFQRIVQRAHDLHPVIVATTDMMGAEVEVSLDPLHTRAAE